jgi:hypothetical protein
MSKSIMNVVTVISDSNNFGFKNVLKPSSHANNLKLKAICTKNYKNHRIRDNLLIEYLKTLGKDDIVFCTDGYDTLFLADESEIISKYLKIGKELLFAAEIVCWPDASLIKKYPQKLSPFRFLNGGGFIGKAGYIINKINEELKTKSTIKYSWSNQIYWTEQYLRNLEEIGIDSQCEIFCTMVSDIDDDIGKMFLNIRNNTKTKASLKNCNKNADLHQKGDLERGKYDKQKYYEQKKIWFNENFIVKNNRILNLTTNSYPCHIHFNGESNVLLPDIMKQINFSPVTINHK